jgi:hypothetical protein
LTSRRNPRDDVDMPRVRFIRMVLALSCAAALAAPLGGCDKCGDWPWTATQKSCHGEAVR